MFDTIFFSLLSGVLIPIVPCVLCIVLTKRNWLRIATSLVLFVGLVNMIVIIPGYALYYLLAVAFLMMVAACGEWLYKHLRVRYRNR